MPRLLPAPVRDDPFAQADGAEVSAEFEQACVDFFADVTGLFGVPRSMGQIYGLLYGSPQPLSFTDIAGKLDISRGSTSQGLQALRSLGAVVPVSGEGEKRELFQPELSLRKLVSGLLREKVDPIVSDGGRRLDGLKALASASPNAAGKKFAQSRVNQIETWRRQMRLLLPLLKTILGPVKAKQKVENGR